jgi:hypothetical protein
MAMVHSGASVEGERGSLCLNELTSKSDGEGFNFAAMFSILI